MYISTYKRKVDKNIFLRTFVTLIDIVFYIEA